MLRCAVTVIVLGALLCPVGVAEKDSVVGDLRLHDLESEVFGNRRSLRVWLPPGYDAGVNSQRRYPVLYMNDGQALFDAAVSTLNSLEWRADETATELIDEGVIEPVIIVGIDNAGRKGRANEYLPYYDEFLDPPLPNPQGFKYPEFMAREVLPFVEARYRTIEGRSGRGIGGASYGALAALYAVVHTEGTFGRLLIESPSLYVQDVRILKEAGGVAVWPERIFVGVGTNEEGRTECDPDRIQGEANKEILRDVRSFQDLLGSDGSPERLLIEVEPCGGHSEFYWSRRFKRALSFLFPLDASR